MEKNAVFVILSAFTMKRVIVMLKLNKKERVVKVEQCRKQTYTEQFLTIIKKKLKIKSSVHRI